MRFSTNRGIARSVNVGLKVARDVGASWLLTLDQDSDLPLSYVENLVADVVEATRQGIRVGVIGPRYIHGTNGTISYPESSSQGWPTTAEILQSGALWSVAALDEIGGFDESLGIDAVDTAACLSLRERGFDVVLSPSCTMNHEWGNARWITLLGRRVAITGHSPERRTTMVRNRLRLAPREFRRSPVQALRSLRRLVAGTVLAVTVEDDRLRKAGATLRGLTPGRARVVDSRGSDDEDGVSTLDNSPRVLP